MGCVSGTSGCTDGGAVEEDRTSEWASAAPFVVGGSGSVVATALGTADEVAESRVWEAGSSCAALFKAGRFASGRSVGAEGEEGSSKGRLAEDMAVVEVGEADMSRDWTSRVQRCILFNGILIIDLEIMYTSAFKENGLVLVLGRGIAKVQMRGGERAV